MFHVKLVFQTSSITSFRKEAIEPVWLPASVLIVAVATIDRATFGRAEGNLGRFSAPGAGGRKHLPRTAAAGHTAAVTATSASSSSSTTTAPLTATLGLARCSAIGAALRIIFESPLGIPLLVRGGVYEFGTAVSTCNRSVCVTHLPYSTGRLVAMFTGDPSAERPTE